MARRYPLCPTLPARPLGPSPNTTEEDRQADPLGIATLSRRRRTVSPSAARSTYRTSRSSVPRSRCRVGRWVTAGEDGMEEEDEELTGGTCITYHSPLCLCLRLCVRRPGSHTGICRLTRALLKGTCEHGYKYNFISLHFYICVAYSCSVLPRIYSTPARPLRPHAPEIRLSRHPARRALSRARTPTSYRPA